MVAMTDKQKINLTSPLINTEKPQPQALRGYQESAVQAVLEAWGRRVPDKHAGRTRPVRALVSMATGGGKTTVFAEIIRRVMTDPEHQRALLFCDTEEIIQQMFDRVQMQFAELLPYYKHIFAPGIGIVMGQRDLPHARIVVATRQSLHPKRLAEVLKHGAFDFIIVDECFPAGTLVNGKPIETYRTGDPITAYDECMGIYKSAQVTRVFRNPVGDRLCRVVLSNTTIVCTCNHPFMTLRGWIPASGLLQSDVVQCTAFAQINDTKVQHAEENDSLSRNSLSYLREGCRVANVAPAPILSQARQSILLKGVLLPEQDWEGEDHRNNLPYVREVCHAKHKGGQKTALPHGSGVLLQNLRKRLPRTGFQGKGKLRDESFNMQRENAQRQESNAQSAIAGEDANYLACNGVEADTNTGKWTWSNGTSNAFGKCIGLGDGSAYQNRVQARQPAENTLCLQGRYSQRNTEDRNRSGRTLAWNTGAQGGRCEARCVPNWVGVESVEILESSGDREFGGLCPDGHVYNLEVTPYHTYTVSSVGVVVHNCHGVSPDNTAHRVIQTCELANPEVKIAGFTATPKRADRKALGVVFDEIVYSWSIRDGVEGGYLAPATRLQVGTDVDLSAVKTEFGDFGGDYNQTELSEVLTAHEWVDLAVTAYQAHLQGRRKATLAYFPFVDMSKAFTAKLKALGIRAEHVDGGTDKRDRRRILRDYGAGNLEVVSNVMVLSKGFDAPRTDSILMARPTRSETLFTQIVGRGLRRADEKIDCLLVELGVHDVKALEVGHLLGRLRKCKTCQYEFFFGLNACPNCAALVEEVLEDEEEEEEKEPGNKLPRTFRALSQSKIGELFEKLKSAWFRGEDGWITCEVGINAGAMVIMPPTGADVTRQRERQLVGYDLLHQIDFEWREELRAQLDLLEREIARAEHWTLYFVPPSIQRSDDSWGKRQPEPIFLDSGDLDEVLRAGEREAVKRGGASDVRNTALKTAEWRVRMASGAQLDYLHRLGARLDKAISAGEAAQRITYLLNRKRVERWVLNDYLPERGE